MFKKSYLLVCVLAASMFAGLMGAEAALAIDGQQASVLEKVKAKVAPFVLSGPEEATAILRAYLAYSSQNVKKCGKAKKVLTDLARIANESLALCNRVKNEGLKPRLYEHKDADYLPMISLFWICEDICALGGDIFASSKKGKDADQRLKGLIGFIDNKIIPLVEGSAAFVRATANLASDAGSTDVESIDSIKAFASENKFNDHCTEFITAARLASKIINSEMGSTELKYALAVSVIIGFVALHDYAPAKFSAIKKSAGELANDPRKIANTEFWSELRSKMFPKQVVNARE